MNLLYFYDQDCEVCKEMEVVLTEYEKENPDSILRIDVDESEAMTSLFEEIATGNCEGVPFLYNRENRKFICGLASLEEVNDL